MALSMFWSVCEKYFFVDFGGRAEGISVDRLKPAQHLNMPVELALPPWLGHPPACPDAPGKPPVITPHSFRQTVAEFTIRSVSGEKSGGELPDLSAVLELFPNGWQCNLLLSVWPLDWGLITRRQAY